MAALLTALLSSSITHRFCWVSSLFQRHVCFVIDSTTSKARLERRKRTTKTLKQADDHVLSSTTYCIAYVLRVYTDVTKNACTNYYVYVFTQRKMQNSHVNITQPRKPGTPLVVSCPTVLRNTAGHETTAIAS